MALGVALTDDGDLDITNGLRLVSGAEAARGALYYRFTTFAGTSQENPGEWVYDFSYGVPWRDAVLGRYFQPDEIQAVLADVASSTTGVGPVSASQVTLSLDPTTRKATIVLTGIKTQDGDTIESLLLPAGGS